jgi:hypothetical protein
MIYRTLHTHTHIYIYFDLSTMWIKTATTLMKKNNYATTNEHKLIPIDDDDKRKMDRNVCVLLILDKQCHFRYLNKEEMSWALFYFINIEEFEWWDWYSFLSYSLPKPTNVFFLIIDFFFLLQVTIKNQVVISISL